MKRNLGYVVVFAVAVICALAIVTVGNAQEKKGIRFMTYDSTSAGKPVCMGSDAKSLTTCGTATYSTGNFTGTVTAGGLTTAGTVSGASFSGVTQAMVTGLTTAATPTFSGVNLSTASVSGIATLGGISSAGTATVNLVTVSSVTTGYTLCLKADRSLGYCSVVTAASGTCTCN